MARVKRAVNAHKKRRSTLEAASGYRGQRSRLYRKAKEQLLHSATYQYRDRKDRKGDFRQLWITRINAAARANDMTYNRFIQGLRLAGVTVDRKVLADLAVNDAAGVRRARRGCPRGGRRRGHRRRAVPAACSPRLPELLQLLTTPGSRPPAGLTRRPGARARPGASLPRARRQSVRRCAAGRRRGAVRHRGGASHAQRPDCWPASDVDEISAQARPRCPRRSTPQGLVAVCRRVDVPLATALERPPRLVVVLVEPTTPATSARSSARPTRPAPTRSCSPAGVDPYNGKAVRASAGSLFHLDVVVDVDAADRRRGAGPAGLSVLRPPAPAAATSTSSPTDGTLARPTVWLFGNEAHGLPPTVLAAADARCGCRSTAGPRA